MRVKWSASYIELIFGLLDFERELLLTPEQLAFQGLLEALHERVIRVEHDQVVGRRLRRVIVWRFKCTIN